MRTATCAALAASLLLLTACSDPEPGAPLPTGNAAPPATSTPDSAPTDDGASPAPSESSPSAESTPAPTLPPEATTNDAPGAEAFVRYWYDTLNHAISTGDVTALEGASAPECRVCNELKQEVLGVYLDGGRIDGGLVVVTEVVAPTPDETGSVLLSVVIDQGDAETVDAAGRVVQLDAGTPQASQSVVLQRAEAANQWLLFGVAR